ncbi:uncharacterized protein DDB_G0283697 [Aplysia californica]|uniref:Uncharacterized protein DDB_G0283697 n=1 Tax=Aplysia californica TaxID=6500 RepID=A0ABM1A1D4_APLCA|nr:uncharacterized protein DDB_G0283697 [Aplysia californica]
MSLILSTFIITVLSTSKNDTLPGNTQTSDVTGSKTNSDLNLTSQAGCTEQAKSSSSAGLCWETMIGQEVVKLTIMDTVFVIGQIIIIDVVRTFFIKYCNKLCCWDLEKTFPEYPDFKTAENLLHLIGNQGVIWLGAFFAPGLPVLNLLKLLLLVYVRCWSVMMFNAPQQRIFRASRSNNFYYALLLIMLFLCMLPPLFAIVGMEPSPDCGPFSGQEKMYNILTTTMEKELPSVINSVLTYAASPGVILPLFMLLGMTIYYLIAVSRSLQDANNELRMQLEYERTEGRRKVYAMADARHEAKENAKPRGWAAAKAKFVGSSGDSKVANTALSLLEMVKSKKPAAKGLDGFKDLATRGASQQDKSKKTAQAVVNRMKSSKGPAVPVAVIRGKQSIKAKERSRQNAKVPFKDLILDYSRKQQKEDAQPNDEKTKGQGGKKGRGNRGPKKEASKGRYRQRREKSHNRRRVSNSSDDDPDYDDNSDDQSSEEDIVQVHRSRSSGTNSSDNDHHGDDDTNGDRDNKGRRSRNLRDAMKSHNSQLDNKVTKEGSVPSGNSRDRGAPSNGNGRDRTKQNVPSHSRSRGNVGNSESGSEDPEENSPKQKRIGGRGEGGQQQRERERMQEKQKSRARKPQMTRQNSYTDKSGHLRPYDDDEEEEGDNEDTHNSDETDSEEGDAVDHNNGKRVNDSSRGNKATSGRLEKASKGGSSKSNGGREKQSSETNSKVPQPPPKLTKRREQNQSIPPLSNIDRQPFTGASSSKSKRKVAVPKDKNKQPTEIEIIDEVADDSKTNRQQKRKPKKSEQRKGSETSLTGPVPEIRVEDFSENGNSTGSSSNKDKGVNRDNVLKPNTKGGKPKVSPKQEGANKEQLNKKTDKDDRSRGAVRKLSFMFENKAGGNSSATPDVEGEEINTEVEVSPRSGEEESAGVEKNRATDDGSDVSENSYPSTSRDATRNAERDSETQGTSASKDNRPHDVDFGNRRKTRDRRARLSPGDEPSGPAADTDTDVLIDIGQDDEEDIAMATTPSGDPGVNSFRERSSSYGQYRRDRPSVISLGLAEEDVERLSTGGDDVTGRNPTPPGVSAHNAGTPLERKPEVERRSSNGGFAILAITNGNLDIDTEGELDIINNTERQNDNEEQGGGYTDSQTSNKNNPSTGRKILKATGFSNLLKKFQGK